MPHDNEDDLSYDDLFVTKRRSGTAYVHGEDFVPFGSGRKSKYAIRTGSNAGGSHQLKNGQNSESMPAPGHSSEQAPVKSSGVKTKSASSDADGAVKKTSAASDVRTKPQSKPKSKVKTKLKSKSKSKSKPVPAQQTDVKKNTQSKKQPKSDKPKVSSKKTSVKEEILSYAYFGLIAAVSGLKKLFGSKRVVAAAGVIVGLAILFGCVMGVRAIYTSKTLMSDDGKKLDDTAIQERLITEAQNSDKVTYFLIVGVDKSQMLTDCIWVMCFDNQAHRMNVIQIPRDTYVGEDSIAPHKMNAVYKSPRTVMWCEKCNSAVYDDEIQSDEHTVCGNKVTKRTESNINAVIRCVNTRLSLPIDHYVLFDFEGFEKVIDAMGGVDIVLEEEMKVYPNKNDFIVLPAGHNHLDGATTLKFMRNRKIYADGDLGRVRAQRRIIKAMLERIDSLTAVDVMNILSAAYGNFKTDMSVEEIKSFIAPVKKCGSDSLHMFELPGNEHWTKGHPSYYICDEEKAAEEINKYMLPYSQKITAYNISFPELGY